jgi:hypothetical protein
MRGRDKEREDPLRAAVLRPWRAQDSHKSSGVL